MYMFWDMPNHTETSRRGREQNLRDLDRRMAEFLSAKTDKSSPETLERVRRQRHSVQAELATD